MLNEKNKLKLNPNKGQVLLIHGKLDLWIEVEPFLDRIIIPLKEIYAVWELFSIVCCH